MKIRPAILIIENNKILTMQYRYGNEDVYNLPGGNVEDGESLSDTLAREMVEEMGIKVRVDEMILVGEVYFEEKKQHTLHCIFQGKVLEGSPVLNPKETSAIAIKWLNINELGKVNMYPNMGEAIQNIVLGKNQKLYLDKISQRWF